MSYINKSKSDVWGTPKHILKDYPNYFDPCPHPDPRPSWDGLTIDWLSKKKLFVNPPYSNIKPWAKKCYDTLKEAQKFNKDLEIVMLIPARTDTSYFFDYIHDSATLEFIRGRLKFTDLTGVSKKAGAAPFPSVLCIYKNKKRNLRIKINIHAV